MRRLKQAAVVVGVLGVVFAAAQLVRPDRTNPAIDHSRTIEAHGETPRELAAVLDRACNDCHSNRTRWPAYAQIAPLSWVMARAVTEGRHAVNFSEWSSYSPEQQRTLLDVSCQDASTGQMPGRPWTMLHPEAKLLPHDIEVICAASRSERDPR